MKALIFGFIVIFVAVLTVLPSGLGWWNDVIAFLRGALPVVALLIGIVLLFAGISDIKEQIEMKNEKKKEETAEEA